MPSLYFTAVCVLLLSLFSPNVLAFRPHVATFDHDLHYGPVYHGTMEQAVREDWSGGSHNYAASQARSVSRRGSNENVFQSDSQLSDYPHYLGPMHVTLSKRDPARLSVKPPPPKRKSNPKSQERDQKKADDDALKRVKDDDDKTTSQAQSAIDDAHKKADKKINTLNDQQGSIQTRINQLTKEIKEMPSTKGKSRSEQNKLTYKQIELTRLRQKLNDGHLSGMKQLALQGEINQDMNTVSNANKKGNDAQHREFNDDGKAKSDGQKKAEQALAGFLKFLQYFGEIVSDLTMLFPGGGELLGLGMKLVKVGVDAAEAAKVGGTIAKIGKAYKGADKMKKAGDNVNELRKMLGLKPGNQQIQGMNGKQMQQWQDYMVNKLLERAGKNIAVDAKKVSDTNLKTNSKPQRVGRMRGPK